MANVSVNNEATLNNAIDQANGGAQTTGMFNNNVVENAAPHTITATGAGTLILDGQNYSLQGDGSDAALIVATGAQVTVEDLNIANSGGAAISIGSGGLVTFMDDGGNGGTNSNQGVISAPITGAGMVTVAAGAIPLYFTGANTYTGATTVNGDLVIGNSGSIANSISVAVGANGILDISSAQTATGGVQTVSVNDLSGSGKVYVGRNQLSVTTDTAAPTFSGVISNSATAPAGSTIGGGLTVQSGTFSLSGANTYSGSTKIYGTLGLTGGGTIANSSNVSLKASGATLDISGATGNITINELTGVAGSNVKLGANTLTAVESYTAASYSGVIAGTGAFVVGNAPATASAANYTLTLAGVNTYSGATTVTANSALAIGAGGSIAASSGLTDNGLFNIASASGAVTVTNLAGNASTSSAAVSVVLGANRLIDKTTAANTFGGIVSGTGALQVGLTSSSASAGSLTLTAKNAYTGSTVVYGDLILGGGTGSVAASSNVSLKVTGAIFNVTNGDNTVGSAYSSASGSSNTGVSINELTGVSGTSVVLGNNTLLINETTAAAFSGVISGAGGIEVDGSATLTLAGNNTYTGETTIYGSLALGTSASISSTSEIFDNGTFDISAASGGTAIAVTNLSSDSGVGSVILGANTLSVGNGSDFGGVISGSGGLTVNGATVTLRGANTYSGTTTITGGDTLVLRDSGAVGSGNVVIGTGGTLNVKDTTTISGTISGAGGVSVTADGTTNVSGDLTLTGANTYTGATMVTGGSTLAVGAGGSISQTSGVTLSASTTDSATLDISQATGNQRVMAITSNSASDMIVLGANSLVVSGPAGNNAIAGVISGTGGLQIATGDTVTLSGANTYSGSTVVTGTLDVTGTKGSVAGSSNISLKSGSTSNGIFDISGVTNTAHVVSMNELTGQTGTQVNLGGNRLVINETTAATFAGVITDGTTANANTGAAASATAIGGITVNGSAYLTLTGVETYTGQTTIGGYLALAQQGSIATSNSVVDNGYFEINAASTINNLSGTGLVKMQQYTLTVDETVASTTATSTTQNTFSGSIHGAGVFDFHGTNTGATTNMAGVTTAATTTLLTLSGAGSDYSGGTRIEGGTLELGAANAAGSGVITFADHAGTNNNAVLQIDNAALTGGGTASESFANHITGMGTYDIIDLSGLSFSSVPGASSVIATNGHVTIMEGNVSVTLNIDDATANTQYHVFQDSHGGTYITLGGTATTPDATHYHP